MALEVEVDADQVDRAQYKVLQRLSSQVKVPGFRPGKAPREVLRGYVGETRMRQELLQTVVPDAYKEAVAETGIVPVGEPDVEVVRMAAREPLVFKATVPVQPVVKLGDYHAMHIDRQPAEISDEEVDRFVEMNRQSHVRWVPVERPAQTGDRVTLHYIASVDNKDVRGERDQEFELGNRLLPQGVEDGLVGASAGEQRALAVDVPGDFYRRELAGQHAVYNVELLDVKAKELPSDEEFVALLDGVENLEQYRATIRGNLLKEREQQEVTRQQRAMLDALEQGATIEYPSILVNQHVEYLARDTATRVGAQGFTFERYLQLIGITMEQWVNQTRPRAEQNLRDEVTLNELARVENIEPSEADVQENFAKWIASMDGQSVNREAAERALRNVLRREQALKWLTARAVGGDEAAAPLDGSLAELEQVGSSP